MIKLLSMLILFIICLSWAYDWDIKIIIQELTWMFTAGVFVAFAIHWGKND